MRAIVRMFATGDLRNVAKVIDRNYIDHQGLEGIEIRGPEGFSRVVTAARGAVPDLHIAIEDLIAKDKKAVARLRWWGTTLSGKKIERETIDIGRVVGGSTRASTGVADSTCRFGSKKGGAQVLDPSPASLTGWGERTSEWSSPHPEPSRWCDMRCLARTARPLPPATQRSVFSALSQPSISQPRSSTAPIASTAQ